MVTKIRWASVQECEQGPYVLARFPENSTKLAKTLVGEGPQASAKPHPEIRKVPRGIPREIPGYITGS